ncbi:hypothetical protein FHR33_004115 [Nonomuraea dietziae]|uniref:Uncharacterized protein n=2 Tax=Nonomuraea TaxID=83681 RepID=A0A7W5V6P4_9ACTN|nr:hypothetical protein [Nonomuraea dietziae]MBE1565766.1 hypothetical protein [Nonomuraea africana]
MSERSERVEAARPGHVSERAIRQMRSPEEAA